MRLSLTLVCFGLMAGTSLAAPQWSADIQLSNSSDIALLTDDGTPGDNVYQVISLNGTFAPKTFTLPDGELYINMLGGNDLLVVDGASMPTISASFFLFGGAGNDAVVINDLNTTGNITSDDSIGDNALGLAGSDIAGNVAVFDGAGTQSIGFFDSVINGEVSVQSPDGASNLLAVGTEIGNSLFIDNFNYGDDYIGFFGSSTGGDLYANVGIGATTFESSDSMIGGSLSTIVEGGLLDLATDNVGIGGSLFTFVGEGETSKDLNNTIVGGIISFDSGLGFDTAFLNDVTTSEIQINNGEGGSLTEVTGVLDASRFVSYSGQGDDQVEFNGTGFINHVEIVHGDGNGRFESFGPITLGCVTYSSGGGLDIVTLDGTTVQGNFVAYLYNGATEGTFSNVTLDDVYVGGMVDVNATDGSDIVRICNSEFNGPVVVSTGNGNDTAKQSNSVFNYDVVTDLGFDYDILETSNDNTFNGLDYQNDIEEIVNF